MPPPAPPPPVVAPLPPEPVPEPEPEPPAAKCAIGEQEAEALAWLLGYYRATHRIGSDTLVAELSSAEEELKAVVSPRNQVRLALLLSLPDPRVHNPARAVAVLDQYLVTSGGDDPVLQNFAYVLRALISQRNKTEDNFRQAEDNARRLTQRLEKAEAENKMLRDQLDALKSIERSLYERQRGQATEAR